MSSQTVVAFMITMASALAYMHRAEAKAVAVVCRTDTRTDKCAIPADGQMLQTIGRFLELDPGWYLFRTEREHLRIRPPLRTVKGLRSGGQMRADDPPLLRGPGALAAATGGQRRADILPSVGALVYVMLDVDADGVSLLGRSRAGRSSWRICRRVVRSQEGAGRLLGHVGLIGPVQAGLGRAITGRGPDQRAEDGLGHQVVQTGQVHRRQGGQRRQDGVIGQAQQSLAGLRSELGRTGQTARHGARPEWAGS